MKKNYLKCVITWDELVCMPFFFVVNVVCSCIGISSSTQVFFFILTVDTRVSCGTILFGHKTIGCAGSVIEQYTFDARNIQVESTFFLNSHVLYRKICLRACYVVSTFWWVWVHTIRSVKLINTSVSTAIFFPFTMFSSSFWFSMCFFFYCIFWLLLRLCEHKRGFLFHRRFYPCVMNRSPLDTLLHWHYISNWIYR